MRFCTRPYVNTASRSMAGLAVIVSLGAAAPAKQPQIEVADIMPLAKSDVPPEETAPAKKITFQNTMYQAAPMPDEDVDAPNTAGKPTAQVGPRMISPKAMFQGEGYSRGSDQESSLDARKNPAAGLGLNMPLDQ